MILIVQGVVRMGTMRKKIKKVTVTPGCISCGTCEAICPEVFQVKGISEVLPSANLEKNEELIREAADLCPVDVIKIEEQEEVVF